MGARQRRSAAAWRVGAQRRRELALAGEACLQHGIVLPLIDRHEPYQLFCRLAGSPFSRASVSAARRTAPGTWRCSSRRTLLLMATAMLLPASVLERFGQRPDIAAVARSYVVCLLLDLSVAS